MALQLNDARELTTKAAEAARLLAALANEHRLAILCTLVEGERSIGTLVEAVGLTHSALSQHLAKLLTSKGFPDAYHLAGGIVAWKTAGLPTRAQQQPASEGRRKLFGLF